MDITISLFWAPVSQTGWKCMPLFVPLILQVQVSGSRCEQCKAAADESAVHLSTSDSVRLTGTKFVSNRADNIEGVVSISSKSYLIVRECDFTDNIANKASVRKSHCWRVCMLSCIWDAMAIQAWTAVKNCKLDQTWGKVEISDSDQMKTYLQLYGVCIIKHIRLGVIPVLVCILSSSQQHILFGICLDYGCWMMLPAW